MNPFRFQRAANVDDAIGAASGDAQTAFLGGGTTLVDLMKDNVQLPSLLVDVNALPLTQIEQNGAGVRIGALVRNTELAEHPLIRERYPMLSEALLSGATIQLRNAATVGGNLMQRTRCPYFRDLAFKCNKREPHAGCAALEGFNRSHAILGGSDQCIATHASDMCVPMAALDAVIRVQGPKGERSIPFEEFHKLPGSTPEVETSLAQGELIVSVDLPELPFSKTSRYLKVRDRASYEFALASAAVALDVHDGVIREARIALGGAATKPWRAREAEKALKGAKAELASYQDAAKAELKQAKPQRFNGFKIELAQRTLIRALIEVGRSA